MIMALCPTRLQGGMSVAEGLLPILNLMPFRLEKIEYSGIMVMSLMVCPCPVTTFRIKEQARNSTIEPTVYVYDDPSDIRSTAPLQIPQQRKKVVTTTEWVRLFSSLNYDFHTSIL